MSEAQTIKAQLKALTIFDANNKMMSVSECAKYLGVHFNTVKNRIEKGTIKAIFQDGQYHIPKLQFIKKLVDLFLESTKDKIINKEEAFTEKLDNYFKEKFIKQ